MLPVRPVPLRREDDPEKFDEVHRRMLGLQDWEYPKNLEQLRGAQNEPTEPEKNEQQVESLLYVSKDESNFTQHYFEELQREENLPNRVIGWIFLTGRFKNLENLNLPNLQSTLTRFFDIKIREALSRANRPLNTTLLTVLIKHRKIDENVFLNGGMYSKINGEWVWDRINEGLYNGGLMFDGVFRLDVYMVNKLGTI